MSSLVATDIATPKLAKAIDMYESTLNDLFHVEDVLLEGFQKK